MLQLKIKFSLFRLILNFLCLPNCVVPENIHTSPVEDSLICTPQPSGFSIPRGSLMTPPPPPPLGISNDLP